MNDYDDEKDGEAYARNTDPDTSHKAADEVRGKSANEREAEALEALQKAFPGGLTNHEIVAATGVPWNSITPRMKPLEGKGKVERIGERMGPMKKKCTVWRAHWPFTPVTPRKV